MLAATMMVSDEALCGNINISNNKNGQSHALWSVMALCIWAETAQPSSSQVREYIAPREAQGPRVPRSMH